MKRKPLKWLFRAVAILLVGWCLTSIVLSQIIPARKIVVDVTGDSGATISARVTVDGETTVVSKRLPARFEYRAKHFLIEAELADSKQQSHITGILYVNDVKKGSTRAPALRIGYKGPGLLGLGSRNLLISGAPTIDVPTK